MQTAVIEFARNVCGLAAADSTEFEAGSPYPVIYKLRDLLGVEELRRHQRLGGLPLPCWPTAAWRSRLTTQNASPSGTATRFEFNRAFEEAAHGKWAADHGTF